MTDPLETPAAPSGAAAVFGERLPIATAFVAILADTGVSHGLIGPREVPRLWDRHVLNCAVIEDAFPSGAMVIDVGSGAGLPGGVPAGQNFSMPRHTNVLVCAVPGLSGVMLAFDDFLVGLERFGTRILPLMTSRRAGLSSTA